MPNVNIQQLRSVTPSTTRFMEFEREVEDSIRQESAYRKEEHEEEKRAREKRARKKRLRKLRSVQSQ